MIRLALVLLALPPVSTRIEKTEVRLGEPFGYELSVAHPAAESVLLPEPLELPAPFRAAGPACRREGQGEEVVTTCAMRLALFDLGEHDVPSIALRLRREDGEERLPVPGPRVTAVGVIDPAVPAKALEVREPAGPVPLMVRSLRLVWWTLGALAAAALAAAAVLAWRRRARAAEEPPPPVPAHVRFARRLDALEAERLPLRGAGAEHVARLSEAVREYLAAVTGVNALDLTTGELAARLGRDPDPRLDLAALRGFLDRADLVKFARADADPSACAAATAFARELLARTAPPPAAEAPAR